MLDGRGTVKVLDLGLALAGGDEDGSLTREHDEKVLGTADYLAPEQATDSHKADRRSDIYSLGCTLYYLLIGKPPFASGKLAERLQAHLTKPPPNLVEQRPDVPIAIADLYFRMLQKHPDGRPQSAQEVADALGAWLGSGPSTAAPARAETQRRPLPRRAVGGHESGGGVVVRSGPGSGSSGIFPGLPSPGGSGSLAGTPSPSDIARAQPKPPSRPPVAAVPAIRVDAASPAAHAQATAAPAAAKSASPRRPRRDIAGLPLGAWIAVGFGVLLAIGLAVTVALK
jgi:serine/threonine protein kinase